MVSHEANIDEEYFQASIFYEEISDIDVPLFSNHSSIFYLEDDKSVVLDLVHTLLDDGALFHQLDVLEGRSQSVVGCTGTLIVALLPIFSSMMTGAFPQCSFEHG